MTISNRAKECERDLRKNTFNLIVSNYFTVDDMCEIIDALEKQIPKKPSRWQIGHSCCSNCKRGIIKEDRYCCYCGQAIDWSEVE